MTTTKHRTRTTPCNEEACGAVLAQIEDLSYHAAVAVLKDALASLQGEIISYVCEHCGSANVEHAHWVNPNTDRVSDIYGTWNYDDVRFCNDCDEAYALVDLEDFRESLSPSMRKRYKDGVRLSDADRTKRPEWRRSIEQILALRLRNKLRARAAKRRRAKK